MPDRLATPTSFSRLRMLLAPMRQTIVLYGLVLVGAIWIGAELVITQERNAGRQALEVQANNLANVFGRDVSHTITDLDRMIRFLRVTHEHVPERPWAPLIADIYSVDHEAMQIGVVDSTGVMISSSAELYPTRVISIRDREHFRVHAETSEDRLFISKPVIGRVSKKLSIQFSRRLTDAEGNFSGVIVASFDPGQLVRTYSDVDPGDGYGIALIDADGTVLAGAGGLEPVLGGKLSDKQAAAEGKEPVATLQPDGNDSVIVICQIENTPLTVAVSVPGTLSSATNVRTALNYRMAALTLSLATLLLTANVALRRHRYEQQILRMAKRDPLTDLPNRFSIHEELERIFERPPQQRHFALHAIDLDGFKAINDTYGHLAGDKLLQTVAARLTALLTHGEIIGRMGGDEFVVIQPVNDFRPNAIALANKIDFAITQPCQLDDITIRVGVSIGIASTLTDAGNATELLHAADCAMYAVKSRQRGTFCFYDPNLTQGQRIRIQA